MRKEETKKLKKKNEINVTLYIIKGFNVGVASTCTIIKTCESLLPQASNKSVYNLLINVFSSDLGYQKVVLAILISGILKESKKNVKSRQLVVTINAGREAVDRTAREAGLEVLGLAP